jgi:hypothetical protein
VNTDVPAGANGSFSVTTPRVRPFTTYAFGIQNRSQGIRTTYNDVSTNEIKTATRPTPLGAHGVIKRDSHINTQLDPYGLELSISQQGDENIQNPISFEETMADDKKRQAKRVAAENGVFVLHHNISNHDG